MSAPALTERPEWQALQEHFERIGKRHLRDLFKDDPQRAQALRAEAVGLYFDYSKQRVDARTLELLRALAKACNLRQRTEAMFGGKKINATEHRAVLHVALRAPKGTRIEVDGHDVVPDVHGVLDRMAAFCDKVHNGKWTGHTGKRIRNVISIGIGGSDLGPVMAYEALRHYSHREMTFRFVSNVDGTDFAEATRDLDAAETLFIVCSKTFTTLETMTNAHAARAWCVQALGDEAMRLRNISSLFPPMRRKWKSSASTPPTCSASGTGSADATRWTRQSVCRPCWQSARSSSAKCSTDSTPWTSTSATPRWSRTCPS